MPTFSSPHPSQGASVGVHPFWLPVVSVVWCCQWHHARSMPCGSSGCRNPCLPQNGCRERLRASGVPQFDNAGCQRSDPLTPRPRSTSRANSTRIPQKQFPIRNREDRVVETTIEKEAEPDEQTGVAGNGHDEKTVSWKACWRLPSRTTGKPETHMDSRHHTRKLVSTRTAGFTGVKPPAASTHHTVRARIRPFGIDGNGQA